MEDLKRAAIMPRGIGLTDNFPVLTQIGKYPVYHTCPRLVSNKRTNKYFISALRLYGNNIIIIIRYTKFHSLNKLGIDVK